MKLYFVISLLMLIGCVNTGRAPIPPGTLPRAKAPTVSDEQYGHQVVQQLSEKYQIDYNNPRLNLVEDIVGRLTQAAKADQQPWHVFLFKDDSLKNAAATRGNHIFLWSGMLNTTKSDGELAAVLAHEIGHVLAGHTAENPNDEVRRILIQVLGTAAGMAVSVASPSTQLGQNLGNLASVVTTKVGEGIFVNPFSREDEFEADQIGLELMAEAKYDPEEAITFWTRGANDPDFSSAVPFLSTHPPAPQRLERLRKLLPLARARFRGDSIAAHNSSSYADSSRAAPSAGEFNSSPADDRDSFDLRSEKNGEKLFPLAQGGEQRWADEWKVISARAVLYAQPTIRSKPLGEFRSGTVLRSLGRRDGWLRIGSPEEGFLLERDLMPVYP